MNKMQVISNEIRSFNSYAVELISSKYIIYEFFKRDIKVMYIQSFAAPLFYILIPIIQSSVFSFLLNIFSSNSKNISQFETFMNIMPVMIIWNLISFSLIRSSGSYVHNYKMISKVYFSRLVFFISPFLLALFNCIIQFFVFFILYFLFYSDINSVNLIRFIFFPLIILYCFFLCFSVSLFIASISIKYRDVIYILNFVLQLGFFLSPVLYSLSSLSGLTLTLVSLNPFSIVSEIIRWIFFYEPINNFFFSTINLLTIIFLSIFSFLVFKRSDKTIADYI